MSLGWELAFFIFLLLSFLASVDIFIGLSNPLPIDYFWATIKLLSVITVNIFVYIKFPITRNYYKGKYSDHAANKMG